MVNLYSFSVKDITGKSFDLSQLKGKKVMIVNTASECGFTPQFGAMQELYENTNRDEFDILGFPCNDFGGQDPASNIEINEFCTLNYAVTFPMMEKIRIIGEMAHPLFSWLCSTLQTEVKWNFQKFLIDENGMAIKTMQAEDLPITPEVLNWIENGK